MKIGIIGIGLMGGSFALDFRSIYENSKIYGFEFDKKKGSFSLQDRALFAEFDYDSAITFWTQYQTDTASLTDVQKFEKFALRAY